MRRGRVEGKRWRGGPGGGARNALAASRRPRVDVSARRSGKGGSRGVAAGGLCRFRTNVDGAAVAVRVPAGLRDRNCVKRTNANRAVAAVPAPHGGPGALRGQGELRGAFCAKGANTPAGAGAPRGWPGAGRNQGGFARPCGFRTNAVAGVAAPQGRPGTGRGPGGGRDAFLHESDGCRGDANRRDKARVATGGFPVNGVLVWANGAGSARGPALHLRFPAPPPHASRLPEPRLRPPTKSPEYYPKSGENSRGGVVR